MNKIYIILVFYYWWQTLFTLRASSLLSSLNDASVDIVMMNPVNISTSDQRCFDVVDQRWNNVDPKENETKSDVGFLTFNKIDTTSVPDFDTALKQRCATLIQRCINVVLS